MFDTSKVTWNVGGRTPPSEESITTTYGHIYQLMNDAGNFGARHVQDELQPVIDELRSGLQAEQEHHAATAADLATARKAMPATPKQVRATHNAVQRGVQIAKSGLWAAALAFFAGALTQLSPTIALGWCHSQSGPGAVAKCYIDGFSAVGVGILAGVAGGCTWKASRMQYAQAQEEEKKEKRRE